MEDKRSRSVCFTGHRPEKIEPQLIPRIKKCLAFAVSDAIRAGNTHFICGMSRGIDMWAAHAVIEARLSNPLITLEAAVPFPGQSGRWNTTDRDEYQFLLDNANIVTNLAPSYSNDCMHVRNKYMTDNAATLIAYYNGDEKGGTANTIRLAWKHGLTVINIREDVLLCK